MTSKIRLLPLFLLAFAALLFAACGGSGDDDATSNGAGDAGGDSAAVDDGADQELFVSNGVEVLGRSADSFSQHFQSMSGNISFSFLMGTVETAGDASFAYQSPDKMHLSMSFEGGDQQSLIDLSQIGTFEVLARDGQVFMNIPFLGGWFTFTPEDLGASAGSLQDLMTRGSIFDYTGFVESLGGEVDYVGEEDIDGVSTHHYNFSGDLANLIGAFADALSSTGDNAIAQQILSTEIAGPVTVDLWVGDDFLPYRLNAQASMETPAGAFALSLSGNFGHYNDVVSIPEAPADATSFAEVFGALGAAPPAAPTEDAGY